MLTDCTGIINNSEIVVVREMEEDAFVKFGRLWAPVWRTIKTVDVIQQHRHFFHYSYSFINGLAGNNLVLGNQPNFNGPHPSLGEDLSLKIEVHDETIWKSTPEL